MSRFIRRAVISASLALACFASTPALAQTPAPAPTPAAAPACDRACLKGMLETYLDALTKRDQTKLPLAKFAKFTENGAVLYPGEGLWKTATSVTPYRLYALDPEGGQAAVSAVVMEDAAPVIFLLRIKVDAGKISEMETVLCRKGGTSLFAPDKLVDPPKPFTDVVPAAKRNSRRELIAASNAYFEAVETEGKPTYQPAPFAKGANRIENGVQTTNISLRGGKPMSADEQLDAGLFTGTLATDRRYPVVDVETGIALGIVMYRRDPTIVETEVTARQAARGQLLLAEFFKVTDNKIQEIRAVMVDRPRTAPTGWN
jgi:hypothetical protein